MFKMKGYLKSALHVCIKVFVESAHHHVYHLSDVENYNRSETKEHTWWISMAQSIIRDRLLFFCRSFWRVYKKITPSFLKGCKIFWREC